VGEYVLSPAQEDSVAANATDGRPLFTVSPNAVIVNSATPDAIAQAVHHLILYPKLREELGRAGRRTVTERFHLARQMDQYSRLYTALRRKKRSDKKE
jgi:glycosyltransferase involved in cell wall biosynthesis